MNSTNGYEQVTQFILERLRQGTIPWRKPWRGGEWPMNLARRKRYRGINVIVMVLANRPSRWWVTEKQARRMGGRILEGARGVPVLAWGGSKSAWVKGAGRTSPQMTFGDDVFYQRYYTAYNLADTEGLQRKVPLVDRPLETFSPIERAERIAEGYLGAAGAPSIDHMGSMAFYQPSADYIQLPPHHQFQSGPEYYSTLFHEMGHSTGHRSRLKRRGINDFGMFGDHQYSREELVAEFAACFLCAEAEIERATLENSAAYIDTWAARIAGDPRLIVRAANQGQKAAGWILGTRTALRDEEPPASAPHGATPTLGTTLPAVTHGSDVGQSSFVTLP